MDPRATSGLSNAEAARRLREDGYNELPAERPKNIFIIALNVVRQPMFLLLVACGGIYLLLGDIRDAVILQVAIFAVIGITFYQERKTERALEALRDLSSPRALVMRDGQPARISGREVVRGDVLLLAEGDRVPADAVLLESSHLSMDESLLTGESVPVRKQGQHEFPNLQKSDDINAAGGDRRAFVYAGTLVVRGHAVAEVYATGGRSEIGKIGKALQTLQPEETLLQKETGRVVRVLAITGFILCVVVIAVYAVTRQDWLNGFLAGLTLAISMVPEEFPVVLTVFLALGAWRISHQHVLTRRMPAIEALGACTVLCVDKTGTLTLNQMSVGRIVVQGAAYSVSDSAGAVPDPFANVVECGLLASRPEGFDPMERALKRLAEQGHRSGVTFIYEYPLSSQLLAMSRVWKTSDDGLFIVAAKGAPEAIVDLCHLSPERRHTVTKQVDAMSRDGLRVLGVAKASWASAVLPEDQHAFTYEFVGLLGFSDPVRPGVPAAVRECHTAGIRIIMITGDYAGTALAIARQIGLSTADQIITGDELARMSESELNRRLKTVNVFARIRPEQKLGLVQALKAGGEIVGMTGDGVNDAPALKAADIGIAMGKRGTDVAREASALVLLNDDFSSIVAAVKLGRRIFENLRRAMAYIVGVHVPIAGMSLVPVLLQWPLVLLPVHIVFLQLIIDPACAIAFEAEPEKAGLMNRPPRDRQERVLSRRVIGMSLGQGMAVFFSVFTVYAIAVWKGQNEMDVRAMTFTTLIIANLGMILTNRSWSLTIGSMMRVPNPALWAIIAAALVVLALVLSVPVVRELFRFGTLHTDDLILALIAGMISIMWFEAFKVLRRR